MIFCFSGTGNSLHIAKKIAAKTSDSIIMMNESEMAKGITYQLVEDEQLGFVFPIHWGNLPKLVEDFIKNMNISISSNNYVFAVCSYGLLPKNNLHTLRRYLRSKNLLLNYTNEIHMTDNYILSYDVLDFSKQNEIHKEADLKIDSICTEIINRKNKRVRGFFFLILKIPHFFYKRINHQKNFYVTSDCIGCKKCEYDCPSKAIKIENGKPVWIKNCTFCLCCINLCPTEAIQYGKTQGRKRYRYLEQQ